MGKVHGSLARAGKGKSQTPKVRFATAHILHLVHLSVIVRRLALS